MTAYLYISVLSYLYISICVYWSISMSLVCQSVSVSSLLSYLYDTVWNIMLYFFRQTLGIWTPRGTDIPGEILDLLRITRWFCIFGFWIWDPWFEILCESKLSKWLYTATSLNGELLNCFIPPVSNSVSYRVLLSLQISIPKLRRSASDLGIIIWGTVSTLQGRYSTTFHTLLSVLNGIPYYTLRSVNFLWCRTWCDPISCELIGRYQYEVGGNSSAPAPVLHFGFSLLRVSNHTCIWHKLHGWGSAALHTPTNHEGSA